MNKLVPKQLFLKDKTKIYMVFDDLDNLSSMNTPFLSNLSIKSSDSSTPEIDSMLIQFDKHTIILNLKNPVELNSSISLSYQDNKPNGLDLNQMLVNNLVEPTGDLKNSNLVTLKFDDLDQLNSQQIPTSESFSINSSEQSSNVNWVLLNSKNKTLHLLLEENLPANTFVALNYDASKNNNLQAIQDNTGNLVDSFNIDLINKNIYDGVVSDGRIAGATVFVDYNNNGILDNDEPSTITDEVGNYTLPGGGTIVSKGGVDISTNLPVGTLKAPVNSSVVNPITSVIQAIVEKKIAEQQSTSTITDQTNTQITDEQLATFTKEAEQKVATALGIDLSSTSTISLTNVDPLTVLNNNNLSKEDYEIAVKIQTSAIKLANVISQSASFFVTTDADGNVTEEAGTDSTIAGLASYIDKAINLSNNENNTNTSTSLINSVVTDKNKLEEIFNESEKVAVTKGYDPSKALNISEIKDFKTTVLSDLNTQIVNKTNQAIETIKNTQDKNKLVSDTTGLLKDIVKIQIVAQKDANEIKNISDAKEAVKQFQGDNLNQKVNNVVVGQVDPTEKFEKEEPKKPEPVEQPKHVEQPDNPVEQPKPPVVEQPKPVDPTPNPTPNEDNPPPQKDSNEIILDRDSLVADDINFDLLDSSHPLFVADTNKAETFVLNFYSSSDDITFLDMGYVIKNFDVKNDKFKFVDQNTKLTALNDIKKAFLVENYSDGEAMIQAVDSIGNYIPFSIQLVGLNGELSADQNFTI